MATQDFDHNSTGHRHHFAENWSSAAAYTLSESILLKTNQRPSFVDVETFSEHVAHYLGQDKRRGSVGYIELLAHNDDPIIDSFVELHHVDIIAIIENAMSGAGIFCWYGGRFLVFIQPASAKDTRSVFSRISREIAERAWPFGDAEIHATPVVGYSDLILTDNSRELWSMAEAALNRAKASLEIEPVHYGWRLSRTKKPPSRFSVRRLWGATPWWAVLAVQFAVSLILGLGAPFIFYAVCDALGSDVSGPVYIGVVIVLVITATTIWIEGLLALKPTTPPSEPGSPYPRATIIIPAYLPNEAATIIETLRAFLALDYANSVQIIVAYNTPLAHMPVEDEMAALAATSAEKGQFFIEPVRVEGSTSKAQNVNAVVGRVRGRFVGIFDADHHPHPDSLQRAWRWLSNGWDIVQGRCSIRNGTDTWIARMVAIEFEQIYAVSHPGRARFHGFGIFGGSNGFWRTQVLHETRMRHSMLTEDIDSSIRAVVAGYKITGDRDLISEELAPTHMKQLLNQRLRWAQGWFQVSFRRVMPALLSPRVSVRQKLGLIHLLVWRELFPWYSIQVVPIMAYWIMVYGWSYVHWAIPIFLATTVYTLSTGPGQIFLAYWLAHKPMKKRVIWFVEYLFVSTFFFSPFKDALSRIAHVKEAMGERAWKVTPRTAPASRRNVLRVAVAVLAVLLFGHEAIGTSYAQAPAARSVSPRNMIGTLLGGEAATINAARIAAREGRNADAAQLFAKAIDAVPGRRSELLCEYADSLAYSGRAAQAVPLYRELLTSGQHAAEQWTISGRLALALAWSGQQGAALATYDKLVAHDPGNADLAMKRVRLLASLGRSDDALTALNHIPATAWAAGPLAAVGEEMLTEIALSKAKMGNTLAARQSLARAVQHGSERGASVAIAAVDLDSLTRTPVTGAKAEPHTPREFRAALVRMTPGSTDFWSAKRGLAVALSASRADAEALDAWTTYLKHAPGDTDAVLYRARTLANLQQHSRALEEFRTAYSREPRNAAARAGVRDETVALARAAAKADRSAESQVLFADAIKLDPARQDDLLREYADQLSYSGHPTDAIPVYVEWLRRPHRSSVDRKQALVGLANAYSWSGDTRRATDTYTELASAFPDDASVSWSVMVFNARRAAQEDRNGESAKLFADAVALDPTRSASILREYADQLSFTNHSDRAIPLYIAYLSAPALQPTDRLSAERGLAQAYMWAKRAPEAKAAYGRLASQYPDMPEYQWNILVIGAREAEKADRNGEAAGLLAKAIKLDPERSRSILAEYADQLTFTQRSSNAVGFYQAALAVRGITEADKLRIKKSLALAFEWSGRLAEAIRTYEALLVQYPNDTLLKWRYLVVRARAAAAVDKNLEAANLFAKAIELLPTSRPDILKEYADKLTFAGKARQAIPLYRELLGQDQALGSLTPVRSAQDRAPAGVRNIRLALALALSWDKQREAALREYQQLAVADPDDIKAGIGAAQTLSLLGRQSDAIAAYQRLLAGHPDSADVQRGIAQAQDWEGHHREAQATLTRLLNRHPNDLEARRLLAQSLVWSGRPDKAIKEVRGALQLENRQTKTQGTTPAGSTPADASPSRNPGPRATQLAQEHS